MLKSGIYREQNLVSEQLNLQMVTGKKANGMGKEEKDMNTRMK